MDKGEPPERLHGLPSWLINQAAIPAQRLVAEALGAAGLRRYHYALMAVVAEHGAASQAELSRRTTIDRSDVVGAVNELEERGLVRRAPDASDRRRNVVTLTPAGTEIVARLDRVLADVQDTLLAPLTPEERETLVHLLARIVAHHAR
ncbi:MarR family transcriptional regulator [Spiractinospora alimapuensis]|uniref:MarR family winged helix-turn-helix transcriptional regulator n=1 Tax=Spiractinospora alimapuensis TaxID=2820884 RepID=UPI001F381DB6|nr:MarR family transcriptional regulator [Spiractinospora alimapuensis]QVQ51792.1 MarR family transcriptional regulator [Spiractinospora alimapuensis]